MIVFTDYSILLRYVDNIDNIVMVSMRISILRIVKVIFLDKKLRRWTVGNFFFYQESVVSSQLGPLQDGGEGDLQKQGI